MAIVGKSGSGKTTLVKCIFGLEDIISGEVWLGTKKILGPSYNLIPGHEDMKLVSQDFYVLDNHTIQENIFDKLIGYTQEAKQKRADKILRLLELTKLKNTKARNLSSGQKQRVAIARALAIIPKVMLLDEPFSNLDKLLTEKLYSFIISEVKKSKTSVILITHLAEEALKYADSLAVMDEGKIVQMGEKWQVYYQPKNTRLAGLLGDFNSIKVTDAEDATKFKNKNKLFLRPDKLKAVEGTAKGDIRLKIIGCTFNGKCYELLCESLSGSSIMVYSEYALATNEFNYFKISD